MKNHWLSSKSIDLNKIVKEYHDFILYDDLLFELAVNSNPELTAKIHNAILHDVPLYFDGVNLNNKTIIVLLDHCNGLLYISPTFKVRIRKGNSKLEIFDSIVSFFKLLKNYKL